MEINFKYSKMSKLSETCKKLGIEIISEHKGIDWKNGQYPQDIWKCTIKYQGRQEVFDFYSGIGHRILIGGVRKEGQDKWYDSRTGRTILGLEQALKAGILLLPRHKGNFNDSVIGPEVADVISCLILDSDAMTTTFDDWCENLDMNVDSIKNLNILSRVSEKWKKILRVLGQDAYEELKSLN